MPEVQSRSDLVFETLVELSDRILVFRTSLVFPLITNTCFDGELGAVVLDQVITKQRGNTNAVVECSDVVVEEISTQPEIGSVGE